MASGGLATDAELLAGVSVGTFRWTRGKKFTPMPPASASTTFELRGWGPYLRARAGPEFLKHAQTDLSLLDALSFPLSFLFAMHRMSLSPEKLEARGIRELHVVFAGSTAHAERLLFDTNYFAEIGLCYANLRKLHLHFVGPEAASTTLRKSHGKKNKAAKAKNNKKRTTRKRTSNSPRR